MGDQKERARIAREPLLEPEHGVEVEVIGGLVEQQQIGAAHERLREVEPHSPAAGKAADRIVVACRGKAETGQQRRRARMRRVSVDGLVTMVQQREGLAFALRVHRGRRLGGLERSLDVAELAIAVLHERDRRHVAGGRLLRDVRDDPCRRQPEFAGVLVQLAQKEREQARLAAAVGSDEADLVPGVHREVRAFEESLRAARKREIRDAYQARESTMEKRREEAKMRGASPRGTGVYTPGACRA